jgi:hypothetical protein
LAKKLGMVAKTVSRFFRKPNLFFGFLKNESSLKTTFKRSVIENGKSNKTRPIDKILKQCLKNKKTFPFRNAGQVSFGFRHASLVI